MKKLVSIAVLLALASCGPKQNKEWAVEIQNPTQNQRMDEAIVLTRAQLQPADTILVPAVMDTAGNYVASQVDDIDGDGSWDELAFVTNLAPAETANLKIVWVNPADYPQFTTRTNVRYGKMVKPGVIEEQKTDLHVKDIVYYINTEGYPYQMDGIGWENDKVGFRHYYDGRNCRDFFGKRVPDMVLDTVGIRADGTPGDTYHVWADWGRDIMSVGTSFGIGGIGALVDDSRFVRMGRVNADSVDVIDSTRFTLITEGPVRSMFALDFYGWTIDSTKSDVRQVVTIWAGKHNYENKVTSKNLPANTSLITGIVHNFNDFPLETLDFNNYVGMATHDIQSYNKEFWMGMGLLLPKANVEKTFDTKGLIDETIMSPTWCAKLKLDENGEVQYKAYSAWEHEDTMFKNRQYFMDMMKSEGERMDNPVVVTLK